MRLFRRLRKKLEYLEPAQVEQVYQAYQTAAEAHKTQKRQSGEPYITHPVAVACILAEMRMDAQTIMAALMHDVLEDTYVEKKYLETKFGKSVAELVDGVSKLTKIEFKNRLEAQAENLRKMVLAMSRDIRVILVKLADRLHNMRTLGSLASQKRRRIAKETLDIYAPIAHRLGMHDMTVELEDLGFSGLYPNRFHVLKEAIRRARGNRGEILSVIEKELKESLKKSRFPISSVKGREKHIYSIYRKMRDKHMSFNEIMDVYAFRVLVDSVDDTYRALGLVHSIFKPVPERFKDYIAIPKANGYQSLHTTLFGPYGVPIEIQLRTKEMDAQANSGIAAHWLYKASDQDIDKSRVHAQRWIKNLLEMQQSAGSSLEFIENVKIDLFPDEVYVFTPRGAIRELPAGATVVDFAYAVHTDIGNTCVAAKIERQLVPLSDKLKNGQTIEVITSETGRPNPAWLAFVVTAKARSSIRHYLKTQRRQESIALGKQLLEQALESVSLEWKSIPKESMAALLKEASCKTVDDLLEDIGLGNRAAILVAHRLMGNMTVTDESSAIEDTEPLIIKGTEGMVVTFANCCYPIPGDPVVGILNAGKGIVVHKEECSRIAKIRQRAGAYMPVRWSETVEGDFLSSISLEVINRRGALASIALAISDADANIDDISVDERDGRHYCVKLKLLVRDRNHLAAVVRRARQVRPVTRITIDK